MFLKKNLLWYDNYGNKQLLRIYDDAEKGFNY